MKPRAFQALAALSVVAAMYAYPALAENASAEWPTRPIRVLVPFPPGGNMDNLTRLIGASMSSTLGATIVVENKPGGTGQVATDILVRSAPDGYTFMMAPASTFSRLPFLQKLPFDAETDVEAIAGVAGYVPVLAVTKDLGVNSLPELIQLAKQKPGTLSYGSVGPSSESHINSEILKAVADIDVLHVPFKGSAHSLTALLGGHIDMLIDGVTVSAAKDNRVIPLAAFYGERHPELPDVPTANKSGIEVRIQSASTFGMFAPKGVPEPIRQKLAAAIELAIKDPENVKRLQGMSLMPAWMPADDFRAAIQEDTEFNRAFLEGIGLTQQR